MSRNLVIVVVVVLVLVAGGWYLMRPKQAPEISQPNPEAIQAPSASSSSASEGAMMKKETIVKITSSGFSPQAVTIKAGESVTWENSDSENHTVNSAPHPTHTAYPSLNLGVIKEGEKKSLTFPDASTFKYHDHLNPSLTGSVTVQ